MSVSPNYNNRAKNNAREVVFNSLPQAPYRRVLTLPGREALDVKELLRIGAISPMAEQTWVERETSELIHMSKTRDRFYTSGEIRADKIEIVHSNMEDFVPSKPYDLINLDLMCGITPAIGRWIEGTLSRFLAPRATLMVTTTKWSRSPFYAWFHEHATEMYPEQMAEIASHYDRHDVYAEATVMLLMSALVGFGCDQIPVLQYEGSGEKVPMTMFRVDNLLPSGPTNWPTFSEIVSQFERAVPLIERQEPLDAVPDEREMFNRWLAKSHMALIRETGHDTLYHYRDRVVKVRTFDSLIEAMRHFKRA